MNASASLKPALILTTAAGAVALVAWLVGAVDSFRRPEPTELSPPRDLVASNAASLEAELPAGPRTTPRGAYVPAYAAVLSGDGNEQIRLATTLGIHNTSPDRALVLEGISYHGTDGKPIQTFLDRPVALKPLGTYQVFVPARDVRGGTGANFLVHWSATAAVPSPVVEAVMVGTIGTRSYAFVSVGREIEAGSVAR